MKILILTAYSQEHVVLDTVRAGADGYLLKNIDRATILKAVRDVYLGNSVLDTAITDIIISKATNKGKDNFLTPQEEHILELISKGKTNREIGDELDLAEKTVRNYVSRLMKKIKVNNRTEAALYNYNKRNIGK